MLEKKNNAPTISVIIPAYNEEKSLKRCLESLIEQTYRNFEIIVVNDGSTDSTREIALRFNIRLVDLSHGGPGRAKNYGVKIATGRILVFLDADMFVDKNYLRNIIRPIEEKRCIGTYTTEEFVANKENIWAKCWNINLGLPLSRRIMVNNKRGYGQAFRAILRDKFLRSGGFDSKLGYADDKSLGQSGLTACPVDDAICYHYNPETLKDVYYSARWIGRSSDFSLTFKNLVRYSFVNSLRISLSKIDDGAPLVFLIFKLIFDLGIITGILFKNYKNNFAK